MPVDSPQSGPPPGRRPVMWKMIFLHSHFSCPLHFWLSVMSSIRHLFGFFSFTFWRQYLEFVQSCVLSRSGWISVSSGDVESQHVEAKAGERKSFVMFSEKLALCTKSSLTRRV